MRFILDAARGFAVTCAVLLLAWWVSFGSPCGGGLNRLSVDGAWGVSPMVCFYSGPLLQVELPSGELAVLYAGHVFAPSPGYPVVTMYDQSRHDRNIYQVDQFSRPVLIGDSLLFRGSLATPP